MNFSKVKHPLCLLCCIGVTVFFLLYLYADTLNTGALKELQFYRSNSTRFSSNPDQTQTVARSIGSNHKLLNISFRYKHLPAPCNESDRYVIAVHSSPDHLENRNVIRSTWGQKIFGIKVLFLIANATDELLQPSIDVEASEFKDIIQGDFVDSYRNLSYKHVLALKFVVDYCSNIRYLIKVDDDSLVNTPNLKNFLDLYDSKYGNSTNLLCNTMEYSPILRSGRWKVLSSAICHMKPKFAIVGMSTSNANAYIKDHPEGKIPVEKCVNHEKASTSSAGEPVADYSIAVLKLSKTVSEGGTISFVKLPTSKFSGDIHKSCPHGVIMGWGPISATGMFEKPRMTNSTNPDFPKPSPTMNCATVDVKPISECDGSLSKDRVMCTTSTAGKSASIFGDTGCPLMCNDVQVGVIVRMVMPGTPGTLYTRVDYYLDWINEHAFAEHHTANLIIVFVIISIHIVLHSAM